MLDIQPGMQCITEHGIGKVIAVVVQMPNGDCVDRVANVIDGWSSVLMLASRYTDFVDSTDTGKAYCGYGKKPKDKTDMEFYSDAMYKLYCEFIEKAVNIKREYEARLDAGMELDKVLKKK